MIVLFALAGAPGVHASAPAATARSVATGADQAPANPSLDGAAAELQSVDAAFKTDLSPAGRDALRERALHVEDLAQQEAVDREAELARLSAQAAQLGPVPKAIVEAADIQGRRRDLAQRQAQLDSTIKRAKLIEIEADQIAIDIEQRGARDFSAAMLARTNSPLLPGFWRPVTASLPADLKRLRLFMRAQANATWRGIDAGQVWIALVGLIVAGALVGPARLALHKAGRQVMMNQTPGTRLRRSGLALWRAILGTLVPTLAAIALIESLRSAGMVSVPWEPLADALVQASVIAGLIGAVGGALLQCEQPSWRLLQIADDTALRLRPWTVAAAGVAVISVLLAAVREAARISPAGASLGDILETSVHLGLGTAILVVIGKIRLETSAASVVDTSDDRRLAGIALIALIPWATVFAAALAVATGYVALAVTMSRLLLWLPVVIASLYLILLAIDDLCTELIAGKSRLGTTLHDAFGFRRSLIDQLGVGLSATLRILAILFAAGIAFAPFGSNFNGLIEQAVELSHGETIGQITIEPLAILRSIAVLVVGLYVVRVVQTWLVERFLPATELDAAARNSISTVARYIGLILAALWALAALGIGFQRIALILSALSVGIGFGLQAITQNFISGLILLIERPVKIGDLIRVGDQEGDVKRINVRATEIEVGDKSTLIVPNSELITKAIRNMTLADPIGRVQVEFAVPAAAEIEKIPPLVLGLFTVASAVLDDPPPRVFIDSLVNAHVHFLCVAYVRSQREVYAARSEILLRLIPALRAAGITIEAPAATILRLDRTNLDDEGKAFG